MRKKQKKSKKNKMRKKMKMMKTKMMMMKIIQKIKLNNLREDMHNKNYIRTIICHFKRKMKYHNKK